MKGIEARLRRIEAAIAAKAPGDWKAKLWCAKFRDHLNITYGTDPDWQKARPEDMDPEADRALFEQALDRIYGLREVNDDRVSSGETGS